MAASRIRRTGLLRLASGAGLTRCTMRSPGRCPISTFAPIALPHHLARLNISRYRATRRVSRGRELLCFSYTLRPDSYAFLIPAALEWQELFDKGKGPG